MSGFRLSDIGPRALRYLLEGTFIVRILQPWSLNIGKRLVKRPKLYLCDSGLLYTLLSIDTPEQLHASPRLVLS